MTESFADACARVAPIDVSAQDAARARHERLTKPPGSLGMLEDLGVRLAGITGACPPPIPATPVVAVFAGDHGVVAAGVTPWPQEVTAQMVANFAAGGAAINAIARQVGAAVRVVDVGVAADLSPASGIDHRNVRRGTDDLSRGPAMSLEDAGAALDVGTAIAGELVRDGCDLLITGEMGIGNTTPSAALLSVLTERPAHAVTGRGTGIDDATLARKMAVVEAATQRVPASAGPLAVLADVGGLEIAALTGFVVGAAAARVPLVVDGVIALAATVVAEAFVPGVSARCIAGHRSTEPGACIALEHLGLEPVLDLRMRLGEGSGACLAVPVVQAAARVLTEMATFDEASVADDPLESR